MRILFVTPFLPSPPRFGAERRLDGLARELAQRHDVSMLWFNVDRAPIPTSFASTGSYCRALETSALPESGLTDSKKWLQLRSLLSRRSFERLQTAREPSFQRVLDRMLAEVPYDIVQFESVQVAGFPFARRADACTRFVLDEHNIEYDVLRRTTAASRSLVRRLYNGMNWPKVAREERSAWRRFDGITLTSDRDRSLLTADFPSAFSAVIPNGVDLEHFRNSSTPSVPHSLLFFGALNYFPNYDGVLDFIDRIFPLVRQCWSDATFVVVGPGAPETLRRMRRPGVEIVGEVSDVGPYLERASAVVIPLRIGGGTRLKIIEALAKGRPVVSTPVGAEGLKVAGELHVLLADEPLEFARQIGRLFADPMLATQLGEAGRRLVEEEYDWKRIARELEGFYERLLRRAPKKATI